ncbi:helix-turn-helix domain-containing protein [Henriciella aquimarina]|uniref:helix-turn-helix domain-containing protein n=1 Tax=Henriciella aquimarina TaxID=545261 RepID=UPI0009FEEA0D|nr:helix-turn-helix transcriptional regulator [Henriciella aquimarina]
MTLADWLTKNNLSDADFADRIGVSRQALHRYKTGARRPHADILTEIVKHTGGQVTANDFFNSKKEQGAPEAVQP